MVNIPDNVFDQYNEFADDFINSNFGINCKLVYPATNVTTASSPSFPGPSDNMWQSGGMKPFNIGPSIHQGGSSFNSEAESDIIKLRVYFRAKDWVKIDIPINIPDGAIQVIGFMSDLPKFEKASIIIVNSDMTAYKEWVYSRLTDGLPHGFKRDRYFIAMLKRER